VIRKQVKKTDEDLNDDFFKNIDKQKQPWEGEKTDANKSKSKRKDSKRDTKKGKS
jgi:hypothetical protein